MLVEMALTLTVCAVVLELMLVYRFRLLLELFERNFILGLAFSLVLSHGLGETFGATGMVVLIAAIASTIVMATVYRTNAISALEPLLAALERFVLENGHRRVRVSAPVR